MTRKLLISIALSVLITTLSACKVSAQNTARVNARTSTDSAITLEEQIMLRQNQRETERNQIKEDFRKNLAAIKDQAKKAIMERVNAKIMMINMVQTDKLTDALYKLQIFVDRVSGSATGTAKLEDITTAKEAMDIAGKAIAVQAEKNYTIIIADESTLKANAGSTVNQFRKDIMEVRRLLLEAKKAVMKLFSAKAAVIKNATNSANF